MNKRYRNLLFLAVGCAAVLFLVRYFGIHKCFTLERLQEDRMFLMELVEKYHGWSVIVFIFIFALVMACGIPVLGPLTLVGGFLFGTLQGILYSLIGATLGVTGLFLIVRYFLANTVRERYGKQLAQFNQRIGTHGRSYLLTMHLMSVIPYFVIAILAGLADVSLFTFVWTTILGSLPLVTAYAFAGKQLGTMRSVGDIFSPSMIGVLILLALLALLPMLIRRARAVIEI